MEVEDLRDEVAFVTKHEVGEVYNDRSFLYLCVYLGVGGWGFISLDDGCLVASYETMDELDNINDTDALVKAKVVIE